jgi:hypothetical protein
MGRRPHSDFRIPPSLYKSVFWCYFATIWHEGEENQISSLRSQSFPAAYKKMAAKITVILSEA